MKRMAPALALLSVALWPAVAPAQPKEAAVHTRTAKAPIHGIIKHESSRVIQFIPNGKKELLVPADDIVDVEYEIGSVEVKITKYRPAIAKEQEAAKAKEG